jgi:hypothetical protein
VNNFVTVVSFLVRRYWETPSIAVACGTSVLKGMACVHVCSEACDSRGVTSSACQGIPSEEHTSRFS